MTSGDILKLLLSKHHKEVCIPECKSGSTWMTTGMRKMDLWVMYKSWTNPRTICYEIKVSRNDFLNDDKWKSYLDYCSEFYFVAPPNIIDPKELPPEAGLLVTSVNCKMLYTKKKSAARGVNIPEDLFRYILMGRVKIKDEQANYSKKQYWENWLREKKINREFGYGMSKTIQKRINEEIEKARDKNTELETEMRTIQIFKQKLIEFGFDLDDLKYSSEYRIERLLEEFKSVAPEGFIGLLNRSLEGLNRMKDLIDKKDKQQKIV